MVRLLGVRSDDGARRIVDAAQGLDNELVTADALNGARQAGPSRPDWGPSELLLLRNRPVLDGLPKAVPLE